jgi:hypothetical protein
MGAKSVYPANSDLADTRYRESSQPNLVQQQRLKSPAAQLAARSLSADKAGPQLEALSKIHCNNPPIIPHRFFKNDYPRIHINPAAEDPKQVHADYTCYFEIVFGKVCR